MKTISTRCVYNATYIFLCWSANHNCSWQLFDLFDLLFIFFSEKIWLDFHVNCLPRKDSHEMLSYFLRKKKQKKKTGKKLNVFTAIILLCAFRVTCMRTLWPLFLFHLFYTCAGTFLILPKKMALATCHMSIPACAFVQSDLGLCCSLTKSMGTVLKNSWIEMVWSNWADE